MAISEKLPALNSGRVRVYCDDPEFLLEGYLGAESPRLTGGFGGWNVTGRPRQVGMVTWDGVDPFELTFQLLYDGILGPMRRRARRTPRSVEPELRRLVDVVRGTKESDPGIVHVNGIPSLPAEKWVIKDIQFGDAIRRVDDMHRVRLAMDFTLLEYVSPHFEAVSRKNWGKAKRKTVVITVSKETTPAKIAKARRCGWTAIRQLNQDIVKSANQKLKKGTKLRVPIKRPVTPKHGSHKK